ncbi:MAG: DNA polymerase domain-containing protein [Anaeromyxobacter sp.]
MASPSVTLTVAGREVTITNPAKVYFPPVEGKHAGYTKLDLVRYYLAVADPVLRSLGGRPMAMKRYVDGIAGEAFYQKRAPEKRPDFVEVATFSFPSGRTAEEVVLTGAPTLAWAVNLGCIDLHPHPVRADDLDHPDELRVDLDPVPGVAWPDVCAVAVAARDVLRDFGLVGWPKTSGSRGLHVWVRIERRWEYPQVRRAALALAREVERRVPALATSKWWKEERHGVFLDYNQNARDRTTAGAWSVRPVPDARVSTPLTWDEVPTCDPAAFTVATVPARYVERGDPFEGIDAAPGSLDGLLELSRKHEAEGLGDAPWPPHFAKAEGEGTRVAPSRARKPGESRRVPKVPLLTIAKAAAKADALAGLERWKARHPAVVPHLEAADVLVDSMRGRSSTWTRVRVNLVHVPAELRPAEEPPDPDYDPWEGFSPPAGADEPTGP